MRVIPHIPKHCSKVGMTVNSEMYLGRLTVSVCFGSLPDAQYNSRRVAGLGCIVVTQWRIFSKQLFERLLSPKADLMIGERKTPPKRGFLHGISLVAYIVGQGP